MPGDDMSQCAEAQYSRALQRSVLESPGI